jgi:hypothetical protein
MSPNSLQGCQADSDTCDGTTHICWECGGDGWVESDDWQDYGEEYMCSVCRGNGGWPCPDKPQVT